MYPGWYSHVYIHTRYGNGSKPMSWTRWAGVAYDRFGDDDSLLYPMMGRLLRIILNQDHTHISYSTTHPTMNWTSTPTLASDTHTTLKTLSGWWYTYPSETHSQYMGKQNSCSSHHLPVVYFPLFSKIICFPTGLVPSVQAWTDHFGTLVSIMGSPWGETASSHSWVSTSMFVIPSGNPT